VRYSETNNRTLARIYTYILGTSPEVPERKKEVITMELGYSVPGRATKPPESIYFRLVSYSPNVPQYTNNHGVTIFVDDSVLLNDPGFNWYADDNPPPTASESYGIQKLKFLDFQKMAKANTLSIQLGTTKINITGESLDAVRDLLRTVEN